MRALGWALLAEASSARIFYERSDLRAAVIEWSWADKDEMISSSGHISEWDVSRITNMSCLFKDVDGFNDSIHLWDTSSVTDMSYMFSNADVFNQEIGNWNTSNVRDMRYMFSNARSFNQDIGNWSTSQVTDMRGMFENAHSFNQPLRDWDTSSVTEMSEMFKEAYAFNQAIGDWKILKVRSTRRMFDHAWHFNQPIGLWNTSAVEDMSYMFSHAHHFSQPINSWDCSAVKNMSYMFCSAPVFNQPIGAWNTGAVVDMSGLFKHALCFNQPIGSWDTSSVINMRYMFSDADAFDQPIGSWNTSNAQTMSYMFYNAVSFAYPIGNWDTSSVTDMSYMFRDADSFNQPIGGWDTSAVTDMAFMFCDANGFNQPIGDWDTSRVQSMTFMFCDTGDFNQPLDQWDVSSVTDMSFMFSNAVAFDQPIGYWNTSKVVDMSYMFYGADAFHQYVGTWDVGRVEQPAIALKNTDLTACMSSAILDAWGVEPREQSRSRSSLGSSVCPKCLEAPCPSSDMACVEGLCAPVAYGFIHMGRAMWPKDALKLEPGAESFHSCADLCDDGNCTGFVMEDRKCYLTWSSEQPNHQEGSGDDFKLAAFQKATCATFSCPVGSELDPEVLGQSVDEATCCKCSKPGWVKDLRFAPALQCQQCPLGHVPSAVNASRCEQCPAGSYAQPGFAECHQCGPGSVPAPNQGMCQACPPSQYSQSGYEKCQVCQPPLLMVDDTCIWWHMPLIALALVALFLAIQLVAKRVRKRHTVQMKEHLAKRDTLMQELEAALWLEPHVEKKASELESLGMTPGEVAEHLRALRAEQSLKAGVSLRYLLSGDFEDLARGRTQLEDPSFNDMKPAFWLGADPLGGDIICPRDLKPGCALVDWLPQKERREQTHFMSWTWSYRLSQVQSALWMYQASSVIQQDVYFYMCFFVNNQFRIIVERSMTGSSNLGVVFNENLTRVGKMVAILDTWKNPVYLGRVWTIYEQFMARSLDIPVTFAMPESSNQSLQEQISRGDLGIREITESLSSIDVQHAKAWDPQDEIAVKGVIQASTPDFSYVNNHVTRVMVKWIGEVVKEQFQRLIDGTREQRSGSVTTVASSCGADLE